MIPPCVFEVPDSVPFIAVVGYADEFLQLQVLDAGFFLHFAEGCHFYVFSRILVALWQVPYGIPADQEEVASAVFYKSTSGIHLQKFPADARVCAFYVACGNVDPLEGVGYLEHFYHPGDSSLVSDGKSDCIRVGQNGVVLAADDDASFFEIYFAHFDEM